MALIGVVAGFVLACSAVSAEFICEELPRLKEEVQGMVDGAGGV